MGSDGVTKLLACAYTVQKLNARSGKKKKKKIKPNPCTLCLSPADGINCYYEPEPTIIQHNICVRATSKKCLCNPVTRVH